MKKTLGILALAALILTGGAFTALAQCGWGNYYGGQGNWYSPRAGQGSHGGGWGCGWYGQGYMGRGHMGGYGWNSQRGGWSNSSSSSQGNGLNDGYQSGDSNVHGGH